MTEFNAEFRATVLKRVEEGCLVWTTAETKEEAKAYFESLTHEQVRKYMDCHEVQWEEEVKVEQPYTLYSWRD